MVAVLGNSLIQHSQRVLHFPISPGPPNAVADPEKGTFSGNFGIVYKVEGGRGGC